MVNTLLRDVGPAMGCRGVVKIGRVESQVRIHIDQAICHMVEMKVEYGAKGNKTRSHCERQRQWFVTVGL